MAAQRGTPCLAPPVSLTLTLTLTLNLILTLTLTRTSNRTRTRIRTLALTLTLTRQREQVVDVHRVHWYRHQHRLPQAARAGEAGRG